MAVPPNGKLAQVDGGDSVSILDVLHAAPRIWSLLSPADLSALRSCSHQSRLLHDAACTALNVTIRSWLPFLDGITALRNIVSRGCKPVNLSVTTQAAAPAQATHDILSTCGSAATSISLRGPHAGIRQLPDFVPSLQRLELDLYDTAASTAADAVLAATSGGLTALHLHLYGGAVLPYEGLAACVRLQELRLQLGMDKHMAIGGFKYGNQQAAVQRRRGGGGDDFDSGLQGPGAQQPGGGGGSAAAGRPEAGAAGDRTEARTAGQGPGRRSGRPVPPAVAAIASLPQLHTLELYGSALDRILFPEYRLVGLSELRNLTRLRVDIPVSEYHWSLNPLLASLTWLQDLDLGSSYGIPETALPVLSMLPQLTQLRCGTILTPFPNHQPNYEAALWWQGVPAPQHEQQQQQQQGQRQGQAGAGLGDGVRRAVPLPPALEHLKAKTLPSIPVLAAMAALPNMRSITQEPVATTGGARGLGAASAATTTPATATATTTDTKVTSATAAASLRTALRDSRPASSAPGGSAAAGHVIGGAAGSCARLGPRDAGGQMAMAIGGVVVVAASGARQDPVACSRVMNSDPQRDDGASVDGAGAAAAGSSSTIPAAAPAPAPITAPPAEPIRLTLVGEEGMYPMQTGARPEDVAEAIRLLLRVLPPAALRRVTLSPYGRCPALLRGPHAPWLGELAPLAGVVEGLELASFMLAPGDLDALTSALPGLKTLGLFLCKLDADDVRRCQDTQPAMVLRLDSSCEFARPGRDGAYVSESDYDSERGYDSEEFVDEAEIGDPDPEPLGVWPIAAELQRAYERAFDVTDDEEGGEDGERDEGENKEEEEGEAEAEEVGEEDAGGVGEEYLGLC